MEPFLICTSILGVFIIVFGFVAYVRYLQHKEIIALAEKGIVHPDYRAKPEKTGKSALRWGIVFTSIGVALLIGIVPLSVMSNSGPGWLFTLFGLIPTFFGVGLILIYVLTHNGNGKTEPEEEQLAVLQASSPVNQAKDEESEI